MFSFQHGKRPIVEESQIISSVVCVRNFLLQRPRYETFKTLNLNNETDVKNVIEQIELGTTINLTKEISGKIETTEPNLIKMTYTKSNLDKGFIFWFVCNICKARVKYLYFPPNSPILACRNCHKLCYKNQNSSKKFRNMDKWLKYNKGLIPAF